ncbi:MAG: alpha-mannosidase, partial [Lactococcus lactis]|nr:alpha-mannosidase [Lactococcus lactis]
MKVESIDTRHGSLNQPNFSNGNTLPYTGTPFGMNYFILQSQSGNSWHFDPTYPIIQGFRLTHQPSPWMGDYSWMLFTPITGKPRSNNMELLQSSYRESEAIFNPHKLYAESLRYRVKTTIVPSKRGAKFQIKNNSSKELGLLLSTENNT